MPVNIVKPRPRLRTVSEALLEICAADWDDGTSGDTVMHDLFAEHCAGECVSLDANGSI